MGTAHKSKWHLVTVSIPDYGSCLSLKTNISKFQFDPESEGHRFVSRNRLLSVTLVKQKLILVDSLIIFFF